MQIHLTYVLPLPQANMYKEVSEGFQHRTEQSSEWVYELVSEERHGATVGSIIS